VKQGGLPDEASLEQTTYPFPTQLIWRYLGIRLILLQGGGLKSEQGGVEPLTSHFNHWVIVGYVTVAADCSI